MKNTRQILLVAFMLLVARGCLAYDFESGGFKYNIISNVSPYTVELSGMTTGHDTIVSIPSSVNYNNNVYSVISIGSYAIYRGLTSVTIPNSVTSIGYQAFYGCTSLTSVTIGNSVTSIGSYAFVGCTRLIRANFTGTIAQWCDIDFGDYANPIYYSRNLYINNQLITNLVIPNTVNTIKKYAFLGDTCITSLTIGNSVTSIGDQAFYGCTSLTSLTIGNSVTSIGSLAFYRCTSLTRTNYTGTIAQWCNIDFSGFYANPIHYSRNLYINNQLVTNLVIPNTVDTIKRYAFVGDTCITSVTIPNSVTSIGNSAFSNDTNLTIVNFNADSCYNIGNYIFNFCNNLRTVSIGNNVKYISKVFSGCTKLTEVTIPNSVTNIGDSAFFRCSGLTSITFRRPNTMIGTDAFGGLPVALPIHIPCGSSAWYISKMPNFSNFIEGLQYNYSVASQDTIKGTVATITAPTCNMLSWTISASANTGYTFSRWSDGNTQNPRILTVTQDTVLVAFFNSGSSPQWYHFNVVSEDTIKGTVQILAQPTQSSPQATFVALPNAGYTFSRWSDGNTQNPRTLTVTQDTVLVACFTSSSQQWYSFNVVSEDVNKGTVQILAQPTQSSPQATFVALPNTGYTFSRWSDGNTQNPRSITVTQDTILIAFFSSNQGIAEARSSSITLYPNPTSDKVTLEGIGNEANVFIINAMGKIVKRLENVSGSVTFSVVDLPKGIYFVRVGTAVRKLVVE